MLIINNSMVCIFYIEPCICHWLISFFFSLINFLRSIVWQGRDIGIGQVFPSGKIVSYCKIFLSSGIELLLNSTLKSKCVSIALMELMAW